jgi:hypothetical protein
MRPIGLPAPLRQRSSLASSGYSRLPRAAVYCAYPSTDFDTLVLISGSKTGLHLIAEDSKVIALRTGAGMLNYVGQLV